MSLEKQHKPVLLNEAVDALQVETDAWYLDGTFGRGGHTREILKRGGRVIAFDFDEDAIEFGQKEFAKEIESERLLLVRTNFDDLKAVLAKELPTEQVNGFLFDFGTSTEQLTSTERGFSFESDQVLDMRMDQRLGVTANDMLKVLSEKQLIEIFREFGGEHEAKSIAKEIKKWQSKYGLAQGMTGSDLAQIAIKVKRERTRLHPATKVFQALRIAVNSELDNIIVCLEQVNQLAKPGTRLVTIAFHDGEDRIVKHLMLRWEKLGRGHRVNKEIITASESELAQNIRARSAKLRIFEYEQK